MMNILALFEDFILEFTHFLNPELNPRQIADFIHLIFLEHLQLVERWVKMSRKFMKIRTAVKRDEERIKKFIKVANHSQE
jgi:hypothetical protein